MSLDRVPTGSTRVTGGIFRERMNLNRKYLAELDPQCLLQNFYLEAAIIMPGLQIMPDPEKANLHWGWEAPTCQLRGHFLGHWMSAVSQYVALDHDEFLAARLSHVVKELKRCQEKNGGEWVGSIPEKYMDLLAVDDYIWSPQYTMHKTVMGLVDTYRYTGNETALEIVSHLADWYLKWTERITKINPDTVYKGEQAGMLEMWAELWALTKEDKYRKLVDAYKGNDFYAQLDRGEDALTDRHTNASIPLSHGSARMYEITEDPYWSKVTDAFWDKAVTGRGMYATTGNNAGEFWIPPFRQGQYIGDNDQEFCTVYNMVRTADYLLRRTGDLKYADYIERALYNGFLAQQSGRTGMPTYFLPLHTGSRKTWGSKTRDFWCCFGTMVQAQVLYPQLIYYSEKDTLRIMQYIPSETELLINDRSVRIEQSTEMSDYDNQVFFDEGDGSNEKTRWSMKIRVSVPEETEFTLCLRIPDWTVGKPHMLLDGKACEIGEKELNNRCIEIKKSWKESTICIVFPAGIVMEALPDMPEVAAAVDGPVVLAGVTGSDDVLSGDFASPEKIFYPRTEHTYGTYPWRQSHYITRGQKRNLTFKPLYDIEDEEYTVYFSKHREEKD